MRHDLFLPHSGLFKVSLTRIRIDDESTATVTFDVWIEGSEAVDAAPSPFTIGVKTKLPAENSPQPDYQAHADTAVLRLISQLTEMIKELEALITD